MTDKERKVELIFHPRLGAAVVVAFGGGGTMATYRRTNPRYLSVGRAQAIISRYTNKARVAGLNVTSKEHKS